MVISSGPRAGMTAVLKGLALEVAQFNITINNLLPERFDTDRQIFMAKATAKREGITFENRRDLTTRLKAELPFPLTGAQTRAVREIVMDTLPHTIVLAISAMLLATLLAIPLGVLAATRPGSALDRMLAVTSIVAISIPSLVAGLMLLVVFGVRLGWFPIIGTGDFSDPVDYLHHLVLPTIALALGWIGYLARLLRASLVDALGSPYVRAATAYGVRNRVIFFRYALKNAFIPTLAVVGFGIASLMGGALFVEVIFTRKGVGTVLSRAISQRNFPIVQGVVLVVSALFIATNLLVDLAYRFVDPRVRVEEASQT